MNYRIAIRMIHNFRAPVMVFCAIVISALNLTALAGNAIVADSTTHQPLPNASVFDRNGKIIGICNSKGAIPHASAENYPLTIRHIGYIEKIVDTSAADTIFLQEYSAELPEVVVESRQHKALHMLAYVREYSSLSTYTDTVFLFREKMVDYMLTPNGKTKFKGWRTPRVLQSRSYYRFTNNRGLDSVSTDCGHHFSWSDWIGIVAPCKLPLKLQQTEYGADTIRGKYSATESWAKNNSKVTVDINVLADTASRRWVPNLSVFFRNYLDFENFRVRFNYGNVAGDSISPVDLTGYSFNIESNGRGHDMFMFNRPNEPYFVSTYAEVYMLDKEYITIKEAKKWEHRHFDTSQIEIYEPAEAPELQPSIQALVDRVNAIDKDGIRLALTPDARLVGRKVVKKHFGQRVLQLLKVATGISRIRSQRNLNNKWSDFKKEQILHNNHPTDEE